MKAGTVRLDGEEFELSPLLDYKKMKNDQEVMAPHLLFLITEMNLSKELAEKVLGLNK